MGLYNWSKLELKGNRSVLDLFIKYNLLVEHEKTYLDFNFVIPLEQNDTESKYLNWGSDYPMEHVDVFRKDENTLLISFVTKNTIPDKWLLATSKKYSDVTFKFTALIEDEALVEHISFVKISLINGVVDESYLSLDDRLHSIASILNYVSELEDEEDFDLNELDFEDDNYLFAAGLLELIFDEDEELYIFENLEEFYENLEESSNE